MNDWIIMPRMPDHLEVVYIIFRGRDMNEFIENAVYDRITNTFSRSDDDGVFRVIDFMDVKAWKSAKAKIE